MSRIWAIGSPKGGVGKTTTAACLGAVAGASGMRVLCIDLDSQGNLSQLLGIPDDGDGMLQAMTGEVNLGTLVQQSKCRGVDIIACGVAFAKLDQVIASMKDSALASAPGLILRPRLRPLADKYDLVLLDLPPALALASFNALFSTDEVIACTGSGGHEVQAVGRMVDAVEQVKSLGHNPELDRVRIIPCRIDPRTRVGRDVLHGLNEQFADMVTKTAIRPTVRVQEASLVGAPVVTYDPNCAASEDYRSLANELFEIRDQVAREMTA